MIVLIWLDMAIQTNQINHMESIDYSDHLLAVIKALDLSEVYFSGESLGGWVAAWFAAYHPEYVKAMVLNTPGNVNNKPEVMKKLKESTVKAVLKPTMKMSKQD